MVTIYFRWSSTHSRICLPTPYPTCIKDIYVLMPLKLILISYILRTMWSKRFTIKIAYFLEIGRGILFSKNEHVVSIIVRNSRILWFYIWLNISVFYLKEVEAPVLLTCKQQVQDVYFVWNRCIHTKNLCFIFNHLPLASIRNHPDTPHLSYKKKEHTFLSETIACKPVNISPHPTSELAIFLHTYCWALNEAKPGTSVKKKTTRESNGWKTHESNGEKKWAWVRKYIVTEQCAIVW